MQNLVSRSPSNPAWLSHVGHAGTDTIATHLALAAGPDGARTWTASHGERLLPVTFARDRCLLDHLQVFQDLALEHGLTARIDLPTPTRPKLRG